jgi:hypothetical protein
MHDPSENRDLLTLANCKPLIRDAALVGEWIAGVTPKAMGCRLAYLMQVAERLTRTEYWTRYKRTRHDSIYKPIVQGGWKQLKNPWHVDEKSKKIDLSSGWVLLSTEFFVFANSYVEGAAGVRGLALPHAYSGLSKEGMRGAGHFIELPGAFLPWVQKQPRRRLSDFVVLKDFGNQGCGCCDE